MLLHGEDVREVCGELEPELEGDRIHRVVLDHHDVLHRLADEPLARDRELIRAQAAGERVAEEERRREVLDLARRERQRLGAVDLRQSRERKRVSCVKKPLVASPTSPMSSQMQNVDPSRIVNMRGLVANDSRAGRLRERRDDDLVDVHVRRAREREHDAVGDVLGVDRAAERDVLVDRARLLLVAAEADEREALGLDQAGRERRDADRLAEEILANARENVCTAAFERQ